MIQITENIRIDEKSIRFDFVRSSGPGGQHVNKTSTAAQLRFDVKNCPDLSDRVKARLIRLAGARATREGELIIDARRHRSREQNRRDAIERLVELIAKAARPVKPRKKGGPSAASRRKRIEDKRRRGKLKTMRRSVDI